MIQVSKVDVWGFEHAIRGMRNPHRSWSKIDSKYNNFCDVGIDHPNYQKVEVGPNDLDLMHRLFVAGPEHRKYLRQIKVSMDILAPRYWYTEFDTYKIGVTSDSDSTMHMIHTRKFSLTDFSYDHIKELPSQDHDKAYQKLVDDINYLNYFRDKYLETNDKAYWWQLIERLPQSYNQLRTVDFNYENVFNIIHQRASHKLDEWREFVDVLWNLPYVKQIYEGEEDK